MYVCENGHNKSKKCEKDQTNVQTVLQSVRSTVLTVLLTVSYCELKEQATSKATRT